MYRSPAPTRFVSFLALSILSLMLYPALGEQSKVERTHKPSEQPVQKQGETPETKSNEDTLFKGMKYRLVGPFRGGRSLTSAGIPGDPTTYYFGSTGGGVWKSTDGAMTWTPLFDKEGVGCDRQPGRCELESEYRLRRHRRGLHPRQYLAWRWNL